MLRLLDDHPPLRKLEVYAQIRVECGTQRAIDLHPDVYEHIARCEECNETVDQCLRVLGDDSWV